MKKTTLSSFGALLATATISHAASVSWDGSSNTITENPADGTNNNSTLNIAETNTFSTAGGFQSPTSAAGAYTGGVGAVTSPGNADFYAAVNSTDPSLNNFSIFDGGTNDLLARVQHSDASATTTFMIVWDFGGSSLQSFELTNFSAFGGAANANVASSDSRFIFQDSVGSWFISGTSTSIADATAESWLAYTPHGGGDPTIGAAATPNDYDAQYVGYYAQVVSNANGGAGAFANSFSATAVVPEPSSTALLGLGLGAFILRRRK